MGGPEWMAAAIAGAWVCALISAWRLRRQASRAAAEVEVPCLPQRVPGANLRPCPEPDAESCLEPTPRDIEDLLTGAIRLLRAHAEQTR